MDINNNQQINTFVKGMNTDTSDALIGSDLYRYAENLRLVTNTELNTGELRLIEGDKLLHTFDGDILYLTSIRKYIVVVLRKDNKWSVLVSTKDNYDSWELIFGECTEPIWTDTFALCGVTRWESDKNVKLYLTDNTGTHNIMIFNIDEDHWPSNKHKDVPTDIRSVSGYIQGALPSPTVNVSNEYGTLKPARVQYAYRFYRYGGAATQLSALSLILSLYKTDTQGYRYGETTSNAVDITTITPDDETLNRIQIYRITYEQLGLIPSCALVKDEERSSDNKYVDTGIDVSTISFEELQSLDTLSIKPKIIESKEDYLFAADVLYETDDVDKKFESIDMTSISSGNSNNVYVHRQFQSEDLKYDETFWYKPGTTKPGGVGLCVDWEYAWVNEDGSESEDDWYIGPNESIDRKEQARYLKHDETYRFGAILYDTEGRKSSVKWIADIRIPNFTKDDIKIIQNKNNPTGNPTGVSYKIRQCYIKFTIHDMPPEVSAVLIVRCNRTINDTRVVSQGIVGRPLLLYMFDADALYGPDPITNDDIPYINYILDGNTNPSNHTDGLFDQERLDRVEEILMNMKLAPSGYMTMQHFVVDNFEPNGQMRNLFSNTNGDTISMCKFAVPAEDVLLFASPEYAYAEDGIKDIIASYKDKLKLEHVLEYDIFTKKKDGVEIYDKNYSFVRPWSWNYDNANSITPAIPSGNLIRTISGDTIYFNNIEQQDSVPLMIMMHDRNDYYLTNFNAYEELNTFKTQAVPVESETLPVIGHIYFNHILPASIHEGNTFEYGNIERSAYPEVPDWNSFSKDKSLRYLDDVVAIGPYSFVNWSFVLGMKHVPGEETMLKDILCGSDPSNRDYEMDTYYKPIGTGGKCVLFKMNNPIYPYLYTPVNSDYMGAALPIQVANLVKPVHPYGGFNERAIKDSVYYQYGAYWSANNPSDIDFKYGDCSAVLFTYNCSHNWYDAQYPGATKMGTVYMVPLESDIDIRGTYGDTLLNITKRGWYVQDKASVFDDYSQLYDAYLYNPAYGQDSIAYPLTTAVYTDISDGSFDSRVHYSELKTNGEWIDNWTKFKAANFDDVDTRYGRITNMRLFKEKLIFWLNNAVGILRVNQRSVVQDANSINLVLGNGGVLDGYDYLSTVYGMKDNQFADAQSNAGLYWWDGNTKSILQLGEQVVPLSVSKNISNYINTNDEVDRPNLVYDDKYKEILCSVVGDGTVSYSEVIGAFTAIYKFNPIFDTKVLDTTITSNGNSIYKINEAENTSTLFGNTIAPVLKYVVNKDSLYNKVYDVSTFGGRFYGGDDYQDKLLFDFYTPLKLHSRTSGYTITNREYDYRLTIPRNNGSIYGDRMRGKTMQCELRSNSNSTDFSIQYVITKYRISWS